MTTDALDFAGLDASVDAQVNDGAEQVEVESSEVDAQGSEEQSAEPESTEGAEQDSEAEGEGEGKSAAGAKTDAKSAGPALPKTITSALKSLLESNPDSAEIKSAVKTLKNAFFESQALTKEFGGMKSVREAKAFLSEIAGVQNGTLDQAREAFATQSALIQNITDTDAMVHAGDPQVWANIVEDLKSEGKMDALPKLVTGGLDSLKAHSQEEYEAAVLPHFVSNLEQTGVPESIRVAFNYLTNDNPQAAMKVLKEAYGWYQGLKQNVNESKKAQSAEAQANSKLEAYKSEQAKAEAKTFKEGTAREADSYSNKALGAALKPFLKMPFFKDFPRETLVDLGNGIKQRLYQALEGDKAYQTQMKALWAGKTPDKGKIVEFHKAKLDAIAAKIVEDTVKARYPGFAKGGTAAGRVAAATAKKEANAKAAASSVSTGKPIYVATKPKDLVRDDRFVKDWQILEISGKGYVKGTDGKMKFVTWRR